MEFQYIMILRSSSTDVTALSELGMGRGEQAFRHISTQYWTQYDQTGITFGSRFDQLGTLASLLSRGKIIWFQVMP